MPDLMHGLLRIRVSVLILSASLATACSIEKMAINSLSGVLADGNAVFESDNDPAFVAEALPFSLKLIDALLMRQPDNQGLLIAAASGYVFYSYAYLTTVAEEVSRSDIDEARELRARARNLLLRAHDYASRALDGSYAGMSQALFADPAAAVQRVSGTEDRDVEMLYWNAVSLALAISSARNDSALLARAEEVEAQLSRALALDEAWNDGALHELAISSAALTGIDRAAIDSHYERALDLSAGERASLFISYAEATAIQEQDRSKFVELLDRALAVNVDAYPDLRLVNTVAQQRARWLLRNIDELFLE
jgi:predicted anti-sigma-YlaC factor YlaD